MIDGYPRALTLVAAIGAGLVGGVFFAFSSFVMRALDRLPDPEALAAMQAINKAAPSPLFMTALSAPGWSVSASASRPLTRLDERSAVYQLVGSTVYLVGVVVTIVYNVPKNDALALIDPGSRGAVAAWRHYATSWTAWNHVRTLTSLASAATFTLALRIG